MRVGALLPDPTAVSRLRLAFSAPWQPDLSTLVLHADWDSLVSDGLSRRYDVCVVDPELGGSDSRGCGYVPEGIRVHNIGSDFILGTVQDQFDVDYVARFKVDSLQPGSGRP